MTRKEIDNILYPLYKSYVDYTTPLSQEFYSKLLDFAQAISENKVPKVVLHIDGTADVDKELDTLSNRLSKAQ